MQLTLEAAIEYALVNELYPFHILPNPHKLEETTIIEAISELYFHLIPT